MNAMRPIVDSASRWRRRTALLAWAVAMSIAGCAAPAPMLQSADRVVQAREILREARASAAGVEDAHLRFLALGLISGWQVVAGEAPSALETAAAIADAQARARILGAIAEVQAKGGDRAGAARTFEWALKTADTIADADSKAYLLRAIAEAQTKAGDVSAALKTADTIANADSKAY